MTREEQGATTALRNGAVHIWTLDLRQAAESEASTRAVRSARRAHARTQSCRILARYLGCSPRYVSIERTANGKPTLDGGKAVDGLSFNLTHSGNLAVMAVARGCRVGVDVEQVRPTSGIAALAARFLSPDEARSIAKKQGAKRGLAFFRTWSRKEAYLKAMGGRVPADLRRFEVGEVAGGVPRVARTSLENGDSVFSLHDLEVAEGYVGALAVEGGHHQVRYLTA